ncbi:hypothetical protein [Aequorivita flava]|uniref:Uncharacterized protein n=1 Tax=Aequorivita flava TaxID=3114371 RepID=A0AB35YUL6_9FLAO
MSKINEEICCFLPQFFVGVSFFIFRFCGQSVYFVKLVKNNFMAFSEDIKSDFQFLDDIILEIGSTKGKGLTINNIFERFYGHSPVTHPDTILNFGRQYPSLANTTLSIDEFFDKGEALDYEFSKLEQALLYLESEKILYKITGNTYELTYFGITRLSKTFVDDYIESENLKTLEKRKTYITLTISIITFLLGLGLKSFIMFCISTFQSLFFILFH